MIKPQHCSSESRSSNQCGPRKRKSSHDCAPTRAAMLLRFVSMGFCTQELACILTHHLCRTSRRRIAPPKNIADKKKGGGVQSGLVALMYVFFTSSRRDRFLKNDSVDRLRVRFGRDARGVPSSESVD